MVHPFGTPRVPRLAIGAFVLVIGCLAACGGSASTDTGDAADVATYTAVIDRFLPSSTDPQLERVLYVTGVGEMVFSLEDQVALIDAFAATHDVRFVDSRSAAVDPDLPGSPPRDDGLLIGVGRITGDSTRTVRIEVYTNVDRVDAQLVTLSFHEGAWAIDSVEQVEPEVLVVDG